MIALLTILWLLRTVADAVLPPYALSVERIGARIDRPLAINETGYLYIQSPGPITIAADGADIGTMQQVQEARGLRLTVPLRAQGRYWRVVVRSGAQQVEAVQGSRWYLPIFQT